MGRAKLGKNHKLYRNSATYASPTWVEITHVSDLMLDQTKGEADVSTRATGGDEAKVGTLKARSLDFTFLYREDDSANALDYTALSDSYENNTAIDMLIVNGVYSTPGTKGWRATMEVFKFSNDQKLTEASKFSVTMKPTDADNPPEPYTAP
jgi:hypothetical protein